jgi:hypothetical protein
MKTAFYNLKQGKETDQAYIPDQIHEHIAVQVIEQCGASLGEDPLTRTMVCKDLDYNTDTDVASEKAKISKTVRDYTQPRLAHRRQRIINGRRKMILKSMKQNK